MSTFNFLQYGTFGGSSSPFGPSTGEQMRQANMMKYAFAPSIQLSSQYALDYGVGDFSQTGIGSGQHRLEASQIQDLRKAMFAEFSTNQQMLGIDSLSADARRFSRESQEFASSLESKIKQQDEFIASQTERTQNLLELGESITSASDEATKVSSVGEFSQLATSQIQETQQYLDKLESFRTPDLVNPTTSFIDPFTGNEINMNTKFEDVYTSESTEETLRSSLRSRVTEGMDNIDFRFDDDAVASAQASSDRLNQQMNAVRSQIERAGYRVPSYITEDTQFSEFGQGAGLSAGTIPGYVTLARNAQAAQENLNYIQRDRARQERDVLLSMLGETATGDFEFMVGSVSTGPVGGLFGGNSVSTRNVSISNSIALSGMSNEEIYQMMEDSYVAGGLAQEEQRQSTFRQEFERRQDAAQSLFESEMRQNEINKAQAARIAEEKEQVRLLSEQQKRDYEKVLSSQGFSPKGDSGEGLGFTDTRPM